MNIKKKKEDLFAELSKALKGTRKEGICSKEEEERVCLPQKGKEDVYLPDVQEGLSPPEWKASERIFLGRRTREHVYLGRREMDVSCSAARRIYC